MGERVMNIRVEWVDPETLAPRITDSEIIVPFLLGDGKIRVVSEILLNDDHFTVAYSCLVVNNFVRKYQWIFARDGRLVGWDDLPEDVHIDVFRAYNRTRKVVPYVDGSIISKFERVDESEGDQRIGYLILAREVDGYRLFGTRVEDGWIRKDAPTRTNNKGIFCARSISSPVIFSMIEEYASLDLVIARVKLGGKVINDHGWVRAEMAQVDKIIPIFI